MPVDLTPAADIQEQYALLNPAYFGKRFHELPQLDGGVALRHLTDFPLVRKVMPEFASKRIGVDAAVYVVDPNGKPHVARGLNIETVKQPHHGFVTLDRMWSFNPHVAAGYVEYLDPIDEKLKQVTEDVGQTLMATRNGASVVLPVPITEVFKALEKAGLAFGLEKTWHKDRRAIAVPEVPDEPFRRDPPSMGPRRRGLEWI